MSAFFIPLTIILVLTCLNGLFVAAGFSMVNIQSTRLTALVEQGHHAAANIQKMLDDPVRLERYIATSQLGTTITSLSLGMYGQYAIAQWLLHTCNQLGASNHIITHGCAAFVTIFLLTFSHVVIGQMVPRSLALQFAEHTALKLKRIMTLTTKLLCPLITLISTISDTMLSLLRIPKVNIYQRLFSPEELEYAVTESHKGGLLSDDEQQIIQNIFDLDERRVGQVMTPRPRIVAISLDIDDEELRTSISTSPYSRFPVFDGDLDHIVGLLLVKDFVAQQIEQESHFDLRALLRTIPAVPEAMTVDRLLVAFKRSHTHLALVFDEYGSTVGIVTLEDVVEEVVGEVHDEFDQVEQPLLREIDTGVFLARGDLMIDDFVETAPGSLPSDDEDELPDVDTIGGLVVSLLGRPPHPGDIVELHGTFFTVESVNGLAINMVRIVLPEEQNQQEDDEA